MIWNLSIMASIVIFILLSIVVIIKVISLRKRYDSDKTQKKFVQDEIILSNVIGGEKNVVYRNKQDSNDEVIEYTIIHQNKRPHLICNFTGTNQTHLIEVREYNRNIKYTRSLFLEYDGVNNRTNPTPLLKSTKYVNIHHVDREHLNGFLHNGKKSIYNKYKSICKFESLALAFLLVPVGDYALKLLTGERYIYFKNYVTALMFGGVIAVLCIFNYFLILRRYTGPMNKGGDNYEQV